MDAILCLENIFGPWRRNSWIAPPNRIRSNPTGNTWRHHGLLTVCEKIRKNEFHHAVLWAESFVVPLWRSIVSKAAIEYSGLSSRQSFSSSTASSADGKPTLIVSNDSWHHFFCSVSPTILLMPNQVESICLDDQRRKSTRLSHDWLDRSWGRRKSSE